MTSKNAESIRIKELTPAMKAEEARLEAQRCLYCYDAPCIQACPTHIDIPKFIRQISTRNLTGSAVTILEANAMGHSCARVCPVEALCEGACVYLGWHEKPIEIARLQRAATDDFNQGISASRIDAASLFSRSPLNGKKAAVVGSGPAGLSCALYLARLGYGVTVFEKRDKPGGLNTYGIAEYKMAQATALEEARLVRAMGVEIKTGVAVGRDISPKALEAQFDAVFIGVGLAGTHPLNVPGEDLAGVFDALTFIRHIKDREYSRIPPGKTTVVIGAGNTAIDAVTQAKRTGTPRVIMAYRRGQKEMPAYAYEFELAKKDEIEFLWNAAPVRILGRKKVEGIELARTERKGGALSLIPGSEFTVACYRVIGAIGQSKHAAFLKTLPAIELDSSGKIKVDAKTLRTTNPKYFAGGDAINGGREVVNAAADGKRAAWGIHQALTGQKTPPPEHEYWISTIEGRLVSPPKDLHNDPHGQKRQKIRA